MNKANYDILNNYWGLIKNLRTSWRESLLEKLKQSLLEENSIKSNDLHKAFGAWVSEDSAEELIQKLRNSRSTNREIESL